jgi:uncharacterized protein involved in exopolysaccharide biosynthesis
LGTLLNYLKAIGNQSKIILYNILILTALAIIISLILPLKFNATARLLPPADEPDLLGFSSMFNISGLSSSRIANMTRSGNLFRGSSPSDLYGAILKSRTIEEAVITKCNLIKLLLNLSSEMVINDFRKVFNKKIINDHSYILGKKL